MIFTENDCIFSAVKWSKFTASLSSVRTKMNFHFVPSYLVYTELNDGMSESKQRFVGRTNVYGGRPNRTNNMGLVPGNFTNLMHVCGNLILRSESNQEDQSLSLYINIVASCPSHVEHYFGPYPKCFLVAK